MSNIQQRQLQTFSQDISSISVMKNQVTSTHGLKIKSNQKTFAEDSHLQHQSEIIDQHKMSDEQEELDKIKKTHKIKSNCKTIVKNRLVDIAIIIFIFIIIMLLLPLGQNNQNQNSAQNKQISQQQQSSSIDKNKNVDILKLQIQDNLPQTIQQKVSHKSMNIPPIQSFKIDQQLKFVQDIQESYHDPKSKNKNQFPQNLILRCSTYMPYNLFEAPQIEYYRWYGKVGKSLSGTLYQTGHLYERHLAINQKCTTQQKRDKKTVFLNMIQLIKVFATISLPCDLHNHKQFQFSQDGKAYQSIKGIDCKTGQKRSFDSYFILYKRATQNSNPSQDQYMKSMFTTLWTFYPKR